MANPQLSPDGKFWWDGAKWQPIATLPQPALTPSTSPVQPMYTAPTPQPRPSSSANPPLSPDGQFWWDGAKWQPIATLPRPAFAPSASPFQAMYIAQPTATTGPPATAPRHPDPTVAPDTQPVPQSPQTPLPAPGQAWSVRASPGAQTSGFDNAAAAPPPPPSFAAPSLPVAPSGFSNYEAKVPLGKAIAIIATTVVVATAGVVGIALKTSASKPPVTSPSAAGSAQDISSSSLATSASATPVSAPGFDRAAAGQQYLAAIGIVNQAESQMNNLINTDMSKPCTCSPGEFNAVDAHNYLPTFDTQMNSAASQMTTLATKVPPSIEPDISAVAKGLTTEVTLYDSLFAAMQNNGQNPNAIEAQVESTSAATAAASAKARADLGLPAA